MDAGALRAQSLRSKPEPIERKQLKTPTCGKPTDALFGVGIPFFGLAERDIKEEFHSAISGLINP